jgi:hypothetical protein
MGLLNSNMQQVALQNTQQQKIMEQQAAMVVSFQEVICHLKEGQRVAAATQKAVLEQKQ